MGIEVREIDFFREDDGTEPLKEWMKRLKRKKKHIEHARIMSRIDRMGMGNFGNHRFLGEKWGELKIDYGSGYRVYFDVDNVSILLLHGGTKEKQQKDIEIARDRWKRYLQDNEGE